MILLGPFVIDKLFYNTDQITAPPPHTEKSINQMLLTVPPEEPPQYIDFIADKYDEETVSLEESPK